MAERRDRSRRLLVPIEQAAAEAGAFSLVSEARLAPLLTEVEGRAGQAIEAILGGAFAPAAPDRAALALFLGLQLLVGRGHRERTTHAAALLGQFIARNLPDAGEAKGSGAVAGPAPADEPEETEETEEAEETEEVAGDTPLSLATVPELARLLAARTWQLVRFPAPVLLTGDTPAVLWTRPGSATAHWWGLGGADEVRVPLDPRHALIVARHAPAGEVVRELTERHARALNRSVAEAVHVWMYYHPESDPMEGVELAEA